MGKDKSKASRVDPLEFELECETWDWARTAGVCAQDLREAVRNEMRGAEEPVYSLAEAA